MRRNAAFTLVEIMIVIAIIGLLAAIAVPAFMRARLQAQDAKFINTLRLASSAVELYAIENRGYPPDTTRGIIPPGLLSYLDPTLDWSANTPIGGQWDWDFDVFNSKAAVSVVGSSADVERMTEIDRKFDDGNLATGRFQSKPQGRYSDIIE